MDTMSNPAPASGWRTMAMVEVDGAPEALEEVLADVRHDCRLHPAPTSLDEKPRFYLVADASRGQEHALRSVGMMLFALDAIARSGELGGFRVVAAEERLLARMPGKREGVSMARSDAPRGTDATAALRSAARA
jgi:hypothetical protein